MIESKEAAAMAMVEVGRIAPGAELFWGSPFARLRLEISLGHSGLQGYSRAHDRHHPYA